MWNKQGLEINKKKMQIKFLKKSKNFKKAREGLWSNVNLFWKLAVGLVLAGVIAGFFFGYYFFKQINEESVLETTDAGPRLETIKQERISKVLQYFSSRQQKSLEIINSPSPIIDPSL